MLKKIRQNSQCTSEQFMFTHKVLRWKDILCGMGKKDKKCHVNSNVGALKFVFFIGATKNVLFSRNFVNEHKISRCISRYFFQNFQTFWNVFFGNGCIYTREPKWISRVTALFLTLFIVKLKELMWPCICFSVLGDP
jgi:hypothetical protein